MKKFFGVFMALLALALTTAAFVSCKNDSDDDKIPSTVAEFYCSQSETSLLFLDNNTVKRWYSKSSGSPMTYTWSGDISSSGSIMALNGDAVASFTVSGSTMTVVYSAEASEIYTKK